MAPDSEERDMEDEELLEAQVVFKGPRNIWKNIIEWSESGRDD